MTMMDTALPQQAIQHRKRKLGIKIVVSILLIIAMAWWLRSYFKPSLSRATITTAVVEKGDVENTLTASGLVLPEFEEVITSPINASIRNVLLDEGTPVKAGQSVLLLDKSATLAEYEKQSFQLQSKRNSIAKLKLDLDKSLYDLTSNDEIKQLRINNLQAAVENTKRLFNAGGGTREDIEQAELNLKVAQLEKKQLENEIINKRHTMLADMKASEIEAKIQENDLTELNRKLQQANIVAGHPGVVTWVNKNIGAAIKEGESLARIADLAGFKVTGTISDNYINDLHNGMTAIIRINEQELPGVVTTIYPSVQNGVVSFDVRLNERNNKLYRPNMKADVFLVTATHTNVLRVANGPAFKGAPVQDIFVLSNGKAIRRTVHVGMSNFDYVEIMDNMKPGETVITSDMDDFKNVTTITITDK